jgi:uncharacterized protein (UPF0212 family)
VREIPTVSRILRDVQKQQEANWAACFEAAKDAGHSSLDAEYCEDGILGCPKCPLVEEEEEA